MAIDSILGSTKSYLGIAEEYTEFDDALLPLIDTAIGLLRQLGVGPQEGFITIGPSTRWDEIFDDERLTIVKTYIHLKVELMFDPPQSSIVLQAKNDILKELEWRIRTTAEIEVEEV